ncbi:cytochrome aa3 quinol oxidase subunit II [Pullulanibacillus pueri]|uniref:Quinol oxidase subunit 2 n=1 Tax=Pullulanibacillus pueri TaxID=1437324 RepID=A0A8J2ZT47_9BACL|nr:cytochrome aa3 quinol oxidase subunit II [Pullulanibacillus pueri]MBM7680315.1 cytochrome aa3 quinol oxidase subunit II [Pullulanibacillus pueri]GGH75697.1 quinol oxidase subunit 2 [Pullulanibacillus pueri]
MKSLWRKGFFILIIGLLFLTGCSDKYPVLNPVGPAGEREKNLIVLSAVLMGIVVAVVIALLAFIVYRYRDKPNNKAAYKPNWDDSKILEVVWWAIPIIIIGVLSFYTVRDTFALTKPPKNSGEPITIEVTSLDWKWMFFYPDQDVATVNYIDVPAGRPIQFVLTSDAPINSFWIPALGGQEYTMPGMAMRLWLQANEVGTYTGKGANFSGKHFEDMTFDVNVVKETDFNKWVDKVKDTSHALTKQEYQKLAKPGVIGEKSFSSYPKSIFMDTVNKNGGLYMNNDWMMKDMNKSDEMEGK